MKIRSVNYPPQDSKIFNMGTTCLHADDLTFAIHSSNKIQLGNFFFFQKRKNSADGVCTPSFLGIRNFIYSLGISVLAAEIHPACTQPRGPSK